MFISVHVIHQVNEDDERRIPHKSDQPAGHTVHAPLAIAESVLDTDAYLGVVPVDGLLAFADLLAFHIAFDHPVLHVVFAHDALHSFAYVGAVGIQLLPVIAAVCKLLHRLGIMH